MIVLNVTYRCKPELREAFLERILAEGIDVASRAEAGNLRYDYFIPFEDSDELLLVEKWRDAEALAAHAETPHYARLKALKPAYVTERSSSGLKRHSNPQRRRPAPEGNGLFKDAPVQTFLHTTDTMQQKKGVHMEEQIITITVRTKGEPCELTDEQIRAWYADKLAALFDPQWGAPEITVELERNPL